MITIQNANVLRASFFLPQRRLFCVVMPQRSDDVICELYRACFYNCTLRILILFYLSFKPAKNTEQWGSRIRPVYALVTFRLQQCSAHNAYRALFPFNLV